MPTRMKVHHQLFLQSFMSRGILNASDVLKLHKTVRDACGDEIAVDEEKDKLVELVKVINTNLKAMGMEIKKGLNEADGSAYYALVNTTESNITLCASQFTENELEFFKKLVEMIMNSDNGVVGSIAAVNITDTLSKKMSKADGEDLLEKLMAANWIDKTDLGKLYLSTRSILELEQYIFDMYPDTAVRCNMCKKLAIQGPTCNECGTKLHNHCFSKFFKDKTDYKCPVCKKDWGMNGDCEQPSTSGTQSRKRKSADKENTDLLLEKRTTSRKR